MFFFRILFCCWLRAQGERPGAREDRLINSDFVCLLESIKSQERRRTLVWLKRRSRRRIYMPSRKYDVIILDVPLSIRRAL